MDFFYFRSKCSRWVACLTLWVCTCAISDDALTQSIPAGETRTSTSELQALVTRLGAPQYVVREDATMKLYDLGRGKSADEVLKLLQAAAKQSDREVRDRAQRVLALLNEELQAKQLADFLSGAETVAAPGWKQFSVEYGDTKVSRSVYGEMLKEEWDFLAKCFASGPDAEAGIRPVANQRFAELMTNQYGYQTVSLGSVLTFFFVSTQKPDAIELHGQMFHVLRTNNPLAQRLRGAELDVETSRGIVRTMISKWIMATIQRDNRYEPSAIEVTLRGRFFEEAKLVSAHILKSPNSLPVHKKTAMQTFAGLNDPAGIPLITPYLKDDTGLRQSQQFQLRDIALTCLMDLNGHDVAKIGVKRTNDLRNPYDYPTLGFQTDEERQKAFDTFAELQAEKEFQERKAKQREKNSP